MRNKQLLLAVIVVLMLPALSGAATLEQFTATADCNTWGSEATILFRPGATTVLLVFSMQLADSSGVEIERYYFEEWLPIPATETAVYPFGAAWTAPLDRPAIMTVHADVYDARGDAYGLTSGDVSLALACPVAGDGGGDGGGGAPIDVCRQAPRWWLRHESMWPVASLMLGGVTYDAGQIERLLREPHRGLVNQRLARQLAVAKLNLANGVANDIAAEVAAADAWLAAHPLEVRGRGHEPRQAARREALGLIEKLCRWNHGGCPVGLPTDDDDDEDTDKSALAIAFGNAGVEFSGDLADDDNTEKAAVETTNLGSLKAMFR
jgi:hypothetical protein